jgi:AAA+ ATPase superfamily predicted ATPase
MKTKLFLMLFAFAALFFTSCTKYPPTSDRLLEDLAIVTQYDTKINFNDYKTYSITNVITKITDKDTTYISDANATATLNQIAENMDARGFVKAAAGEKPDFGIQVLYFQNTNVYVYYYDWWGYYPYWYYYYPYPTTYYYTYTTGMGNIELIDMKNVNNESNVLYIRWNAYIRGLLTGNHSQAEILNSIDQAFTQTPQLQTSGK